MANIVYPQAIIFDCDGTLMDSEVAHFHAYQDLANDLGFELTEALYLAEFVGKTDHSIISYLTTAHQLQTEVDDLLAQKQAYYLRYVEDGAIQPIIGVVDYIHYLAKQGLPLAVASNAVYAEVMPGLNKVGLATYFETVVTVDMVIHGKPAPDLYLEATHRLGLSSTNCLAYEDSVTGITAAVQAGIAVIGVGSAIANPEEIGAFTIIPDFQGHTLPPLP